MTYPQQPAGPAYGYQPQPSFPQQYAQPPTQAAPMQAAPVQQAPVATYAPPQFAEPPRMGDGTGGAPLKIRELQGRACGIRPTSYTPEGVDRSGKEQTAKITFDVLVLDGPVPMEFGASEGFQDNPAGPPVYALDALPAEIKGVMAGNWEIVKACKAILDSAPGNVIPCRIVRGTQGNRPYLMAALGSDTDPQAADADRVRGMLGAAYVAIGTGRWPDGSPYVAPVPREINGGPRQKPTQQAGQPAAQYPPQGTFSGVAPQGQVVYPPAGQPQQAPREAYLSGAVAPDGWNPQTWASLAPEQRAQFLPPT